MIMYMYISYFQGVYIMGATNRENILDPAIKRPGRLETILYVGLPETKDRISILNALTKNKTRPPLAHDVDFLRYNAYLKIFDCEQISLFSKMIGHN